MPDSTAQIVEHQLGHIKAAWHIQWRQAAGADCLRDDRPRYQLDRGRVEDAVIFRLPDAGDGDGGVLQDQLHHLVCGLDIRQGLHHRRAAIGLPRCLQPAEIDERTFRLSLAGEQHRVAVLAALAHDDVVAIGGAVRDHRFDDRDLGGAGLVILQLIRQGLVGEPVAELFGGQLQAAEGNIEPTGRPLVEHDVGERYRGEAEGRHFARLFRFKPEAGRAAGDEIEIALVHFHSEV